MTHNTRPPAPDEVDLLLRNAQLRDELEPYYDESIARIQQARLPTGEENEYLALMLAWERAPSLPIAQWFDPPLELPPPGTLGDDELRQLLYATIQQLYEKSIVLEFTDHLDDRQLYQLIRRDILPAYEKKVDAPGNYLHWDCADTADHPELWLRYYASQEERDEWARRTGSRLPPREVPPFPRQLPRADS